MVPDKLLVALSEELVPSQIKVGLAVGEITGLGLTVTVTVSVAEQPEAVPVTVYFVVIIGETVIGEPGKLIGCQL